MSTEDPTPRCAARSEFGRCGRPADGHSRHCARTRFGEMEWNEPTPIEPLPTLPGTGRDAADLARIAAALHARNLAPDADPGQAADRVITALDAALADKASAQREVERLRAAIVLRADEYDTSNPWVQPFGSDIANDLRALAGSRPSRAKAATDPGSAT